MEQGRQSNDQGITFLFFFRNQESISVDAQGVTRIVSSGVHPEQFFYVMDCIFYDHFSH